MTNVLDKFV